MKESFIAVAKTRVLSALSCFRLRIGSPRQAKSLPQVPRLEPQVLVWEGAGGEGGGGGEGGLGGEGGESSWVDFARLQVEWAHESRSRRIVMLRSL